MIESILHELGFSEKEIKVYLEIVKDNNITATELAKKTKLHRPTVYDIIEKLLEKGLITQIIRHNKKSFQTTEFNKFISTIKEKEDLAHLAIKELNKLKITSKEDYKVEIFEGKEGLKSYFNYMEELLKNNKLKDYLIFGSNLESIKKIKFFILSRLKSAAKLSKSVDYRNIWGFKLKKDLFRRTLEFTGKHKFLPEGFVSECTTVVFNDYVSIIFNTDKPIIIRIYNKKIANTYRNQFNLLWKLI